MLLSVRYRRETATNSFDDFRDRIHDRLAYLRRLELENQTMHFRPQYVLQCVQSYIHSTVRRLPRVELMEGHFFTAVRRRFLLVCSRWRAATVEGGGIAGRRCKFPGRLAGDFLSTPSTSPNQIAAPNRRLRLGLVPWSFGPLIRQDSAVSEL